MIGLVIAWVFSRKVKCSRSLLTTLVLTPAIVQLVIMLVNGNLGAGLAVAGAFSLVRFRSAQGTAQEITGIFMAMAAGLATGMGYVGIAVIFTIIMLVVFWLLWQLPIGRSGRSERVLKITIPENLDYEGVFEDVIGKYTQGAELTDVRTSGMGSLYKLTYEITLRDGISVKEMMDEIRIRNGNLEVSCGRPVSAPGEL